MGYRLHYLTKRITKTEGGYFSHSFAEVAKIISDYCNDAVMYDENGYLLENWEIPRDDFEKMVKDISAEYEPNEILFDDCTCEYFVDVCKTILKNTANRDDFTYPDWIYIEWF